MNMSLRKSLIAATMLTGLSSAPAMAWDDNTLSAALGGGVGGGVGGALGAAIGNEIGGNTGALVGGAVGAAGGTMITNRTSRDDDYRYNDRDYRRRDHNYGRFNGYRY